MGDIADWLIDQQLDYGEWFPRPARYRAAPVHCNRCGTVCYWSHTGERWALTKGGELHNCSKVQPGEFEDLTK